MHIAFFVPYFADGGVETATSRLATCFRDCGHRVSLATFGHDSPLLGPDSPFAVVDLEASRTLTSVQPLRRYLADERPDALLSTHYFANICAVAARTLARTDTVLVLTERLALSKALENEHWLKARLFRPLIRLTYPHADCCVAVSADAAADVAAEAGLSPASVTDIYNPTLVDEVFELAEAPVDHPWFDDDVPVVLGVGRLADQKDFATLLRAIARLRREQDVRLLVLGEGENRQALEALAADLGVADCIDLHGFVDNPYAYMRAADLFALSSRYEGMPNVLVEAAALGTPVVATDCPTGPRELLDGGDIAPLVEVGDVEGLAAAIREELRDLSTARERLADLEDTLDRFRPETACEQYLLAIRAARAGR